MTRDRVFCFCALLLFPCLSRVVVAEAPTENAQIHVSLVDELGHSSGVYTLVQSGDTVRDILFRTELPKDLRYSYWVFEISDPAGGQEYRLVLQGEVPEIIHWDGVFKSGKRIMANRTYYARVILVSANKQVTSSPLGVFRTKLGLGTEQAQIERNKMNLYVFPVGGLYYMLLSTKGGQSASHFPMMLAEVKLAFSEQHAFGFWVEATPNVLMNVKASTNGIFYSQISLSYFYRLWGSLPHPPLLPLNPDYLSDRSAHLKTSPSAFGSESNLEIGFRLYNLVLRGFGSQPIDAVTARESTGLVFAMNGDRRLGSFRLLGSLESGYSVFRGSLLMLGARAGIAYDRFIHMFPSLEARYTFLSGTAADDANDGVSGPVTGLTNQILFLGLNFQFKI